jgi:hypothetical protein
METKELMNIILICGPIMMIYSVWIRLIWWNCCQMLLSSEYACFLLGISVYWLKMKFYWWNFFSWMQIKETMIVISICIPIVRFYSLWIGLSRWNRCQMLLSVEYSCRLLGSSIYWMKMMFDWWQNFPGLHTKELMDCFWFSHQCWCSI